MAKPTTIMLIYCEMFTKLRSLFLVTRASLTSLGGYSRGRTPSGMSPMMCLCFSHELPPFAVQEFGKLFYKTMDSPAVPPCNREKLQTLKNKTW